MPQLDHSDDSLKDRSSKRRAVLLLIFFCALIVEVLLLYIDLPKHKTVVFHAAVSAALILLPFTMLGIVARLPIGKRFVKSRYIIRPFGTLKRESECDGNTIATLLYREIIAWRSRSSRGGIEGRSRDLASPAVSVNLGVTTLPLDWLWTQLRFLLTGKRDIMIDGLLLDVEKPFELRAWTNMSIYTWPMALNSDLGLPEALGEAIRILTPKILESVDPLLAAQIQWSRWNHDEAIGLMTREDGSLERQVALAEMTLDGDYLDQTQRLLDQSARQLGSNEGSKLLQLQGDLQIRRGKFEDGRDALRRAIAHRKCKRDDRPRILALIADSMAYEHNYTGAIEAYGNAEKCVREELFRLTGETKVDRLVEIDLGDMYGHRRESITNLLWVLGSIVHNRFKCGKRLGNVTRDDLLAARDVVKIIQVLEPSATTDLQAAEILEAIANLDLEANNHGAFEQFSEEAVQHYAASIAGLQETLTQERDDNRVIVDLAWSHLGKASCLLRKLNAMSKEATPGPSLSSQPETGTQDRTNETLQALVEKLVRIVREVSGARSGPFVLEFRRARDLARSGNAKYRDHLRQSQAKLLEALLEFEFDHLLDVIDETEKLESEIEPLPVEPEAKAVPPSLSSAAQERATELGLDDEDIDRCNAVLHDLLHVLISYAGRKEFDTWFDTANLCIDIEQSLNESLRLFSDLSKTQSRRMRAEGFYGQACFWAIQGTQEMAEEYLRQAAESTSEANMAYNNRAILDEDLDALRAAREREKTGKSG